MKNKFINKLFLITPLLMVPVVSSSCSFFFTPYPTIEVETNNNFQYISERTFSLRFRSHQSTKAVYGTGWLFAKEDAGLNSSYYDDNYYIATNLHVAAAIQNSGQTTYEYQQEKQNGKNKSGYNQINNETYDYLELGYVITKDENNKFKLGSNKNIESTDNTKYLTKLNVNKSNIAYTSFDLFKQMNIESGGIYGESTFNNGTSDIAILKVNFKNDLIKNEPYFGVNYIYEALDAYNANPTKFGTYKEGELVTIAGFPHKSYLTTNQNGNGTWNGSYHQYTFNHGSKNINAGAAWFVKDKEDKDWWKYGIPSDVSNETIKKDYALKGGIAFKTDEYASYFNIAAQALFEDTGLTGGSSGSMAINDKQEVVGIYWGGYVTSERNNNVQRQISVFDILVNNVTYTHQGTEKIWVKPYNIIEDFKTKNPNTNLSKQ